jgi:hypothetical protein
LGYAGTGFSMGCGRKAWACPRLSFRQVSKSPVFGGGSLLVKAQPGDGLTTVM